MKTRFTQQIRLSLPPGFLQDLSYSQGGGKTLLWANQPSLFDIRDKPVIKASPFIMYRAVTMRSTVGTPEDPPKDTLRDTWEGYCTPC